MPQIIATEIRREVDLSTKAFSAAVAGQVSIDTEAVKAFKQTSVKSSDGSSMQATRVEFFDSASNGGSYIERGEEGEPAKKVYTALLVTESVEELTAAANQAKAEVQAAVETLRNASAAAAPAPSSGRRKKADPAPTA